MTTTVNQPRRVAILKPCCIGDCIMALPAIDAIAAEWDAATIDVFVGRHSRVAFGFRPALTARPAPDVLDLQAAMQLSRLLRQGRYDAVVSLDRSRWLRLAAHFSRGTTIANAWSVSPEYRHESEVYLDVVRRIGVATPHNTPRARPDSRAVQRASELLASIDSPFAVLHPGGAQNPGVNMLDKRWPAERFVRLAQTLRRDGYAVLLSGGSGDLDITRAVAGQAGVPEGRILSGKADFSTMAAVLDRAAVYVGPDTGVSHLAAAVGVPTIAIFGPTNPRRYRPIGDNVQVLAPLDSWLIPDHDLRRSSGHSLDDLDGTRLSRRSHGRHSLRHNERPPRRRMPRVTSRMRDALLPVAGRMTRRDWGEVEDTLLVFQPDHLGDILLSQPAMRHLRDHHPNSRIVAVVGPWSLEIASIGWPVDQIVTIPFPGFTRSTGGSPVEPYRQLRDEARRLLPFRAKAAYILRPDAWWAAWLASLVAPEVITADDPRGRHFATSAVSVPEHEHAALRALRIVAGEKLTALPTASTTPLHVPVSPAAAGDAHRLLSGHDVADRYLVIHPGSGASVKEWPAHRWRVVAEALSSQGHQIILTGTPAEADLCASIAGAVSTCESLAGKTTVPVLAEVLRGATIVIGPDCGPLHLAVASRTPTIHLFGPSDPRRYGPWGDPAHHRVVSAGWHCPRCGDLSPARGPGCGCVLAIQPAEVIDVARLALSVYAR